MSEEALDLSKTACSLSPKTKAGLQKSAPNDPCGASLENTVDGGHSNVNASLSISPHSTTMLPSLTGGSISSAESTLELSPFYLPVHRQNLQELPQSIQRPVGFSAWQPSSSHHRDVDLSPDPSAQAPATSRDGTTKNVPNGDRTVDSRVAPIRPFRTFPMDPFGVYSNSITRASVGLSATAANLHSLYDNASSFPGLRLTPLASHLLRRKLRAEHRDGALRRSTESVSKSDGGDVKNASICNENSQLCTPSPVVKEDSASNHDQRRDTHSVEVTKDDVYWDKRKKNNEAAKRSRDARRQKDEDAVMRVAFFEQENLKLKAQMAVLNTEIAQMQCMLYNR